MNYRTIVQRFGERLLEHVERSERVFFVHLAADGTVLDHSEGFTRQVGAAGQVLAGRPIGELLCDGDRPFVPDPRLCTVSSMVLLLQVWHTDRTYKVTCYRVDGGGLLVGELFNEAETDIVESMSRLTNELAATTLQLARQKLELESAYERIRELSRTDELTGLPNRRYFMERLRPAISFARRHGTPLSLVMADLDHFKRINDRYGHDGGDRALVAFAGLLGAGCRKEDLPARLGGEEFGLLLPSTPLQGAVTVARRLGQACRELELFEDGHRLTASFGVSELRPDDAGTSLLKRADVALYKAKEAGRDRVEQEPSS